jgi:cytochrome c peroxidase
VGWLRFSFVLVLAASICVAGEGPRLEPLSGLPPNPPGNPSTPAKIQLGKMLFSENMMSGARGRSCVTCHKPELFFMDGLSLAWALHDGQLRRKTPSLLNVGWQRSLLLDGKIDTLENQVGFPLKNHLEMDINPDLAAERISQDAVYQQWFAEVFPGEPITFELISKAIAAFERTLVSYDSDLDRYLLGDEKALTPQARRGMELFTGRARCVSCHNGPLLTDHKLHYTGVPESTGGATAGKKYKTASLRDVVRRSSYMHNGHYLLIEQVLGHYEMGGRAPEGAAAEISPVSLSNQDKDDLMAFFFALNGRVPEWEDDPVPDNFSAPAAPAPPKGPIDPSYVNK